MTSPLTSEEAKAPRSGPARGTKSSPGWFCLRWAPEQSGGGRLWVLRPGSGVWVSQWAGHGIPEGLVSGFKNADCRGKKAGSPTRGTRTLLLRAQRVGTFCPDQRQRRQSPGDAEGAGARPSSRLSYTPGASGSVGWDVRETETGTAGFCPRASGWRRPGGRTHAPRGPLRCPQPGPFQRLLVHADTHFSP